MEMTENFGQDCKNSDIVGITNNQANVYRTI